MKRVGLNALLAIALLPGCDGREEVRACEAFVKGQLKAPSTFNQVEANVYTSPIDLLTLRRDYYPKQLSDEDKTALNAARGKRLELTTVFMKYDADNSFGTPLRDMAACDFLVIDGRPTQTDERLAEILGQNALLRKQINSSYEYYTPPPETEKGHDCCIR